MLFAGDVIRLEVLHAGRSQSNLEAILEIIVVVSFQLFLPVGIPFRRSTFPFSIDEVGFTGMLSAVVKRDLEPMIHDLAGRDSSDFSREPDRPVGKVLFDFLRSPFLGDAGF